jgi:16S rRNA (cytosine967-C5)-methyltransferase
VTPVASGAGVRAEAARVLESVLDGKRSLKGVLATVLPKIADTRDRALLEAICFTALRHRRRYEYVLEHWLQRPLPRKDFRVQCLLLVGLAQLDGLGLPPHAAVAATVEATRSLAQEAHSGLVNAILRRAGREGLPVSPDPAVATSHPDWLVAQLRADWPDAADAILAGNNDPAPLWLRVNTRRASRTELVAAFRDARLECESPATPARSVMLRKPAPLDELPGWRAGKFSVQDGAAQLAVEALAPQPGERILDACAAPGGKTAQIAETLIDGSLLALDVAATRLGPIEETLTRLGLASPNVRVQLADASDPIGWWDGAPFDAILLDAPCSATGIIRRQPDIKWHRRESDIAELCVQQARMLEALWPTLRPGGRLLYATCSVLKAENEAQVDAFLASRLDAVALQLGARYGRAAGAGRQRLPGEDGMDGFFYALLEKHATHG